MAYPSICLPTYLPIYVCTFLPVTYLPSYIPTYVSTYLQPIYIPTYVSTYLLTYPPTYMSLFEVSIFQILRGSAESNIEPAYFWPGLSFSFQNVRTDLMTLDEPGSKVKGNGLWTPQDCHLNQPPQPTNYRETCLHLLRNWGLLGSQFPNWKAGGVLDKLARFLTSVWWFLRWYCALQPRLASDSWQRSWLLLPSSGLIGTNHTPS